VIQFRLNRLFHPTSGRCLDVAIDHGLFGEPAFLRGIEDMAATVETLAAAGPDAVQLGPGQAPLLQQIGGRHKPALVLRVDVANVYGHPLDPHLFSLDLDGAVERAVRLDAACVVANLLELPGRPEVRESCIRTIARLRLDCDRYCMPLMVEPLVMRDDDASGYASDGATERVVTLVRQARELGADVIKADPTDDLGDYHRVVQAAVVPLLVRGGGRVSDDVLFERTAEVLDQGAAGIVYGRNIIQHERPGAITRALMAMLHDGASAADALQISKG
jgi:DhnA family fructose-bisphosphate aldolase class Ia